MFQNFTSISKYENLNAISEDELFQKNWSEDTNPAIIRELEHVKANNQN